MFGICLKNPQKTYGIAVTCDWANVDNYKFLLFMHQCGSYLFALVAFLSY